jgi:hypothetical protein
LYHSGVPRHAFSISHHHHHQIRTLYVLEISGPSSPSPNKQTNKQETGHPSLLAQPTAVPRPTTAPAQADDLDRHGDNKKKHASPRIHLDPCLLVHTCTVTVRDTSVPNCLGRTFVCLLCVLVTKDGSPSAMSRYLSRSSFSGSYCDTCMAPVDKNAAGYVLCDVVLRPDCGTREWGCFTHQQPPPHLQAPGGARYKRGTGRAGLVQSHSYPALAIGRPSTLLSVGALMALLVSIERK